MDAERRVLDKRTCCGDGSDSEQRPNYIIGQSPPFFVREEGAGESNLGFSGEARDDRAARCRAVLKGRTGLTFVQENPTKCTAHQLVWLLYHLLEVKAVHALERANVLARAPEMLRRYPQELCSLLSPAISP